jgi:hypothetical protein
MCLVMYAQTNVGLLCCVGSGSNLTRPKAQSSTTAGWLGSGGSNPAVGMDLRLCWLCSGLCDVLITRSEESYRHCVCVCVCVYVCVPNCV